MKKIHPFIPNTQILFIAIPIFFCSCRTIEDGTKIDQSGSNQIVVAERTYWPINRAWWQKDLPRAIYSDDGQATARMPDNATIKRVSVDDKERSIVIFQPIFEKYTPFGVKTILNGSPIQLIGPTALAKYVFKGQKTHIEFDSSGRIVRFGSMLKMTKCERRSDGFYVVGLTSGFSVGSFDILVNRKQLFMGYHDQIISADRERKIFANGAKKELGTYGQESVYTANGIIYFTGSEYGAPPPVQTTWVKSKVAQEEF